MPHETSGSRLMSIREVAAVLHVSKRTIRRLIHSRELPAFQLGRQWRIAKLDLESYLRRRRSGGDPDVL